MLSVDLRGAHDLDLLGTTSGAAGPERDGAAPREP